MKCIPVETKQVMKLLGEAREKFEKQEFEEAQVLLDRAASVAAEANIRSASLLMCRAVNLGALDRDEEAFEAVCQGVVLDPMNPDFGEQFATIAQRLRAVIEVSSVDAADEATPRIYAQLSAVGETDTKSHLAMARYHLATGDHEAASAILESVTLLQPSFTEAWTLLARATRDAALAKTYLQRANDAKSEQTSGSRGCEVN